MAEKNLPKNLTDNRKEIDHIDQKLLDLIHERSKLVINAGKIKKKSGDKTFYRPDREASLIKTLQKKNVETHLWTQNYLCTTLTYKSVSYTHLTLPTIHLV